MVIIKKTSRLFSQVIYMSDASSLAPQNPLGITNDLLYNLKPTCVRARSYRASVPAMNQQTFVGGNVIIAQIPCGRRNSYLDPTMSYMRFTVYNPDTTTTNYITMDNCVASFFDRLDIFHASNLCETIQSYGPLYSYLVDFQMTPSAKQGLSTMYGFNNKVGASTGSLRSGLNIYGGQSLTFCIPILSGLIGLGSDKFVPIGALNDDIRLELSLASNNVACVYNQGTTNVQWLITGFELELQIIELSDEGQSMVESVTPFSSPVYLHGTSWRHYSSVMPAGQSGSFSFLLAARFASLKTLVVLPRRNSETTNVLAYSNSSRINPQISQYFFRCGAFIVPNKPITLQQGAASGQRTTGGYAEGYAEIIKSFHSLNSAWLSSGVAADVYNIADASDPAIGGSQSSTTGLVNQGLTGANSYANGFAIAQEMEVTPNRGDVLVSGFNSLNCQIYFEGSINANVPIGGSSYQMDFFAQYDSIFIIENGLISARY